MTQYGNMILDWFLQALAVWHVYTFLNCAPKYQGYNLPYNNLYSQLSLNTAWISWRSWVSPCCPALDFVLVSHTWIWQPYQCYSSCFDSAVSFDFCFSLKVWSVFLPLSCLLFETLTRLLWFGDKAIAYSFHPLDTIDLTRLDWPLGSRELFLLERWILAQGCNVLLFNNR